MATKLKKELPDHQRAVNALLAVCKAGINNPSRKMRLTFAILAEMIENKSDEWGEDGPDVMGNTSNSGQRTLVLHR